MAELCSPLPLGFLPERGSIPAAGQQPASVVGLSPTAPAWRTNIGGPDLIGTCDREVAQEIGVDLMAGLAAAQRWLAIQGLNPHAAHQGGHLAAANGTALLP
jgi:hypothetical protein